MCSVHANCADSNSHCLVINVRLMFSLGGNYRLQ
jgi:hypothetical protein